MPGQNNTLKPKVESKWMESIARKGRFYSCYFRSSVRELYRKAVLQITERCNLHCAHCFISTRNYGDTMFLEAICDVVISRLKKC